MKALNWKIVGFLLAVPLIGGLVWSQAAGADGELIRTSWPSDEDPGIPFYARVELFPPYIFNDGEWAAVVFYRDPACVPEDFNLISVFDVPGAFSCPHTVHGTSFWEGEAFSGAPKIIHIRGDGAVPVWFVPWQAVEDRAKPDGVLTITDLQQTEGLLVGHADQYTEELQPHPDPAGGGGNPNPKMIIDASGQLEDDRPFKLHISWIHDEVRSMQIQFK